jgi:hypothetical protein
MYKLSILAILFTASVALSCETACEFVSIQNGKCVFQCQNGVCNLAAESNKQNFLNALQRKGFDCISENTDPSFALLNLSVGFVNQPSGPAAETAKILNKVQKEGKTTSGNGFPKLTYAVIINYGRG